MQLTLHLTDHCNLSCYYCFVPRGPQVMSLDVAKSAIEFAMKDGDTTGLLFYGGEPLLEKQLIYDIVEHTQAIKRKTGHNFIYKITTNGTLLDEDFLKMSKEVNLTVGFSHDGPTQDDFRFFNDGGGTFDVLEEKIALLLKYQPYAVAMSVIDPSTAHRSTEIVKFLFDKGFRYMHLSLNYCKTAPWTQEHLEILKQQYQEMAEMYIKWTRAEEKFYISAFDMKILSLLKGDKYSQDRLKLARNQPSVAPDGKMYFSSKYIHDPDFQIGDVFTGINFDRQEEIFTKGTVPSDPCQKCAILSRCNFAYDSLIATEKGIVTQVPPLQCANEQIITPIADFVASTLYNEGSAMFMHKHYNEMYPIMSLVEDLT
ncbi:MAG: radical SAM protein [Defluviitaleaceae bacterium]|nr:radical SAM protein [Defluviitaleaceae bacterium]